MLVEMLLDDLQVAGVRSEEEIGDHTDPRDHPEQPVEPDGRVTNCRVTHSSGVAELDALTCRLMEQRFRFRPSTDRYGRPIADEVDWDQDWIAPRGD